MQLSRATPALWSSLWLVPLLSVVGGIALSLDTPAVDRRFDVCDLQGRAEELGPAAQAPE